MQLVLLFCVWVLACSAQEQRGNSVIAGPVGGVALGETFSLENNAVRTAKQVYVVHGWRG